MRRGRRRDRAPEGPRGEQLRGRRGRRRTGVRWRRPPQPGPTGPLRRVGVGGCPAERVWKLERVQGRTYFPRGMRRRYTFSRAARVWRTTGDGSGGGGGGGGGGGSSGVWLCLPPRRHLDAPPPCPPAPSGGAGAGRRRRRSARSAPHVTSSLPHSAPRRPSPPRLPSR